MEVLLPPVEKPLLRGRLHEIAFLTAIPAGWVLVTSASGGSARAAVLPYTLSLCGLYASSAAYHRVRWSYRAWLRMRRLDHSMIYVLIAGTYTPVSLLLLPRWGAAVLLTAVWSVALFGVALKVLRIGGLQRLTSTMYIGLGWLALFASPAIASRAPVDVLLLIVSGGLLYTTGAIVLWRRWPNPSPAYFGYHEVWHCFVVAASACHFAAVYLLATR
jgi:hemolysin III